ncbi:ArgE/DapE family deacylase [Saccharospirillum salsuginis]|uniref:Acetylornithine deacetylase n=1 Tax=Saccharospirillum salsuginis TaxID=418750 RepID=A0A918K3H2_9GAMM|nr:ArgE/DapE family deacylase [Saccharospirillum salsuginis]GGX45075.1 acetylornithine deacetylase [Saccharospirillum salsuginis]
MTVSKLESSILDSADALFPDAVDFIQDMVGQYSVLGQEQGVLNSVEARMRDLDLPVTRVGMPKSSLSEHPLYAPVPWDHENKYNLVSQQNPAAEGRSLVLNGHLDVVAAEPFDMWSQAPNTTWQRDGWLYGRGTGDMQGGVAAMIYAVHALRHAGYRVTSPLTIQTVVEEECSGNGTLACLHQGYSGDFVLIPEPFGPAIYSGQVGVLWFKLGVRGKPVHVQAARTGVNAIEKLQRLVPRLESLADELNEHHRNGPYQHLDNPFNLNIGTIQGGNWPSSVAAFAEMEGRIGFPPGMTANEIMQRVTDCIEHASQHDPAFAEDKPVLRFHGFRSEGHLIDTTHPGIGLLSDCHHSLCQADPEPYWSTCTTDLRAFHFYNRTGGTCYGPVAKNIHGVDECVNLESIRHTMKAYALFISRWCQLEAL